MRHLFLLAAGSVILTFFCSPAQAREAKTEAQINDWLTAFAKAVESNNSSTLSSMVSSDFIYMLSSTENGVTKSADKNQFLKGIESRKNVTENSHTIRFLESNDAGAIVERTRELTLTTKQVTYASTFEETLYLIMNDGRSNC